MCDARISIAEPKELTEVPRDIKALFSESLMLISIDETEDISSYHTYARLEDK